MAQFFLIFLPNFNAMKTLSTIFLVLFTANIAFAQINAGTALLTGTVSYGTTTTDSDLSPGETTNSDLDLQVGIGYFIGQNFALGLNAGYEMEESNAFISGLEGPVEITTTTSLVTVGPFARLYQMIADKAGFFGELDVNFGFGKREVGEEPGVDISRMEAALRPGVALFLNERWSVEGKFGYLGYMQQIEEYTTPDQNIETVTSDFRVSFNFATLSLGLAFYPGRNTE